MSESPPCTSVEDSSVQTELAKVQEIADKLAPLPDAIREQRIKAASKEHGIGVRVLQRQVKVAANRYRAAEAEKGTLQEDSDGRLHLEVKQHDLPVTACEVAELLANDPNLFFRGKPARLIFDPQRNGRVVQQLTVESVVNATHKLARPWRWITLSNGSKEQIFITLPDRVGRLYLDHGDCGLRPLNGITSAPLLSEDGDISVAEGYDPTSRLWCENVPCITVPEMPTGEDAQTALKLLRNRFRTFAFTDSPRVFDKGFGVSVVDTTKPPGEDESTALVSLITAICRPSLSLAPGLAIRTPSYSGSGTGKGLLVRGICAISMGVPPDAITDGGNSEELDKRITAELIRASPVLFLDNLNGKTLRSDVLASAITEKTFAVRPLGRSESIRLQSTAFIVITGNGLSLSEDLTRRFLPIELDAKMENPETRQFPGNWLAEIFEDRSKLLAAALTIWRWGRQNEDRVTKGKALGSFEQWGRWCRDPLLALGCTDVAERATAAKANDPHRRAIVELFTAWWATHGDTPISAAQLNETVRDIADPQKRGRQYLAVRLQKLEGTRMAGFVLTKSDSGKWGADKYQLQKTNSEAASQVASEHRGDEGTAEPMPPIHPMPEAETGVSQDEVLARYEWPEEQW